MNPSAKYFGSILTLLGALTYAGPALAQCVKPAEMAECTPLKGMKLIGFHIDLPEHRDSLGITKAALRDSTLLTIESLIPEIRVEEYPGRAAQIHLRLSYLGENPDEAPLHFQVAVRRTVTREGRGVWNSTWLTNYVIPASAKHLEREILTSLKESLRRFAADWHRANPSLSSMKINPQG